MTLCSKAPVDMMSVSFGCSFRSAIGTILNRKGVFVVPAANLSFGFCHSTWEKRLAVGVAREAAAEGTSEPRRACRSVSVLLAESDARIRLWSSVKNGSWNKGGGEFVGRVCSPGVDKKLSSAYEQSIERAFENISVAP